MPTTQFPAVFNLTDLNGQNGFKLDGENNNDYLGQAISMAGDINGDGHGDLIIGACYYPGGGSPGTIAKGRSYVVFGGPGVSSTGDIVLSSLNGINGFKLDGENNQDYSGVSVSAAGDVNGDGYADLIIGAYGYPGLGANGKGRSYVMFGGSEVGSNGDIVLSSLNGTNGFKLDGENNGDHSGAAVSAAGDINGDGYADLIIGALAYPGGSLKGRSYVVYGESGIGSSGVFALSSLNGSNGFKLDGENNNDRSGYSGSAGGDINGDGHDDVIIGAYGYPAGNQMGRSYVVFGGPGVGSTGDIALSSLNGANGFKLDGENNGDQSGYFVNAGGDINGDGHGDIIIGAYGYPAGNQMGRSYVVFGGPGVGSGGDIALSSLNGINGFKLDGENNGDQSGFSVSTAGDINSDGYGDLFIGAYAYPSRQAMGRSYVMFGGPGIGGSGVFNLSGLNGANGFKLDGENNGDCSGASLSAASDINGDGITDLIIGASGYPAGSFKGRSYVVFGDVSPQLLINRLAINQGQTVIFTSQNLNATDNSPPSQLNFTVTNVTHGHFALVNNLSHVITTFTQPSVWTQQVEFVHDNSLFPPSYSVQVINPGIALSPPPQNVTIKFYRKPVLSANQLSINQGQSGVVITSSFLGVIDDYLPNQVNFTISNLQHGQFKLLPLNTSVIQFSEQQLLTGEVIFTQDGTSSTPSYQVTVSDPYFTLPSVPATVIFYHQPTFISNPLVIHQGESIPVTSALLQVVDSYPSNQVSFTVSTVQHGQFALLPSNSSVSQFTEQQMLAGEILFIQDGSVSAPGYQVGVNDPYFTLPPISPTTITFYPRPVFMANQFSIQRNGTTRAPGKGALI